MKKHDEIDIQTLADPITAVTAVTNENPTGEKKVTAKWSRGIRCPKCGLFPLEIYNFVNPDGSFVCKVYVCDRCLPSFFTREECDKI